MNESTASIPVAGSRTARTTRPAIELPGDVLEVTFAPERQRPVAKALGRIAFRGGLLTLLTLSIYRFWVKTRQRRLIWSETRIGGDGFEYTGTALELLIGSMVAIAVLAVWLGGANLLLAWLQISAWQDFETTLLLSPLLLSPLIAFAMYRARRYRLLRTRWRGIRCGMDGSAWAYSLRWLGWTALQVISLGLATPLKSLALEDYMTRHMLYGDRRFSFEPRSGARRRLVLNFLLPWLPAMAVIGAAAMPFMTGNEMAEAILDGLRRSAEQQAEATNRNTTAIMIQMAVSAAFLPILLLYPLYLRYRSREIAELISARRLGAAHFECNLGWGATAGPFFAWLGRYLLMLIPLTILAMLVFGAFAGIAFAFEGVAPGELAERARQGGGNVPGDFRTTAGIVAVMLGIYGAYGVFIVATMWLGSVVYFRRLHTYICRGTSLHGANSLGDVRQRLRDEQLESEGFADALDVGGI